MQRRTAVAAASAISMALVSAVIAAGASFGALGFASSPSNPAPAPATAKPVSAATQPTPAAGERHEEGDHERSEREALGITSNAPGGSREGREHDD